MTKKSEIEARRDESIQYLRKVLKPYGTVYTQVVQVSKSGMQRRLKIFAVTKSVLEVPEIENITFYVAKAAGLRLDSKGDHTIIIGGCGFNAGLDVADSLNRVLYPGTAMQQGYASFMSEKPRGLIWKEM